MRKLLPYTLLVLLTLIIVFLSGVKYGRKVEKVDKYFFFILSLTPKKAPTPTISTYSFKLIEFKSCKVSFVFPEKFSTEERDKSLKVFVNKDLKTQIECFEERPKEDKKLKKIELTFKKDKIKAYENNGFFIFVYRAKENRLYYRFKIKKEFYPLISGSVNFTK